MVAAKHSSLPPLPEHTPGLIASHIFIAGVTVLIANAALSFEDATET